jgi:hypothetical protein
VNSCSEEDVFHNGRRKHDLVERATKFTKHGIVYCGAILHDERLLKSEKVANLNYFTHYAMMHNGRLWRGKSWSGDFESNSIQWRAAKFARDVMRLTQDEANAQPVSPSKQAELEIERLRDGLQRLVDLVLSLMQTTLPRVGIVWSSRKDYPLALRNALKLLDRGGGTSKG